MSVVQGSRPLSGMTDVAPPLPTPPKRRRERLGLYLLVVLGCFVFIGVFVWPEFLGSQAMVRREDAAREVLMGIQARELELRESTGHFGFVRELEEAGLLEGYEVAESDGVRWVRVEGYRIEVLLPHGRLGPKVVGIAPDGSGKPVHEDLATRHFSVVARPIEPGVTGYRIWYVDERGELFLNEGVIDDTSCERNALPETQVLGNVSLDTASFLLWQRSSEVPPTRD